MIRLWTSLGLAAFLFVSLFVNSFLWLIFVLFFTIGSGIEFSNTLFKGKVPAHSVLMISACVIFPVNAYLREFGWSSVPDTLLITAIVILSPLIFILNRVKISEFRICVPMAVYGSLWIGYLMSFLVPLYFLKINGIAYGIQTILFLANVVVASDTAAYYAGSALGKTKLAPQYSPKKTLVGAIGGLIGGILIAYVCYFSFAGELTLLHTGILAVIIVVFGQLGDISESVFKRSCSVKDTGEFLPGHGGILDRIDSLVLSAPALYWYLQLVILN